MYLPKQAKKPKHNPFKVQYSVRFLYASGILVVVATGASFILAMQQVQQRDRRAQRELRIQRPGQRVVIVGGGAGGAALASSLCNSSPDLHVTVIEKDRTQTFMAAYPLAHVGHRSYDLNTTGGIDLLRAPASWNVTRDAHLVSGEAVKVLTDTQEVVVSPLEGTAATFSASSSSSDTTKSKKRSNDKTGTASSRQQQQPYRELENGLQAYPYDVLVVACGAKRTLGPLEHLLPRGLGDIDRYGIAVNPGVTRDTLAHLFQGNVVQVKVPPKSFYALMEAERKGRPPATVVYDGGMLATGSTEDNAFFAAMAKLSGLGKSNAEDGHQPATSSSSSDAPPPALHPYMFATSRQHGSTFVSTTNTIWKYLNYFNKFGYCQLVSVTADADPLGPAPVEVNDTIRDFWTTRQEQSQYAIHLPYTGRGRRATQASSAGDILHESAGGGCVVQAPGSSEKTIVVRLPEEVKPAAGTTQPTASPSSSAPRPPVTAGDAVGGEDDHHAHPRPAHFHFLNNSYPTAVDPDRQLVTLYNHVQNTILSLPYRLLLLDLPLTAPSFLRESGLARGDDFARVNAPETLAVSGQPFFPRRAGTQQQQQRVPRHVQRTFEDESSFVDVDPSTLQHRRFNNVFALGDVAGLPTEKGYGATFAQVPVVAHNVKQVLYNQRSLQRIAADEAKYEASLSAFEAEQRSRSASANSGGVLSRLWGSGQRGGSDGKPKVSAAAAAAGGGSEQRKDGEGAAVPSPPRKPTTDWFRPRAANARYDGYSSFPVIMTTWRAMWPEMKVSPALLAPAKPLGLHAPSDAAESKEAPRAEDTRSAKGDVATTSGALRGVGGGPDLSRRLVHCDNHLWNNLAWRDVRGVANGAYLQMAMYESMYFYGFTRGVWYPPGWFAIPSFSVSDGTMEQSGRGWLGFL